MNKNFTLVKKLWVDFAKYNRNTYQLKLKEKCFGAIREYACCALACLNKLEDRDKYIYHWISEYVRLGSDEFNEIAEQKTTGNWNKSKAIKEVLDECREVVKSKIAYANTHVKTSYNVKRLKVKLKESDFDRLFTMIENKTLDYRKELDYWGIPYLGYRFFGETKPHYDDYLIP